MDSIVGELTGPSNPRDFVGRADLIEKFYDLLREFLRSNRTIRWVHISGGSGTGKSSFLRKIRLMAEQDRIATGSVDVPISPKLSNNFLTDIKKVIDEMAPEWRNFIRKRRNTEVSSTILPPEANEALYDNKMLKKIIDSFFADLLTIDAKMKEQRIRNGIFLDDLDRFIDFEYFSILDVWPLLMEKVQELELNLIFVTTSHQKANPYLKIPESTEKGIVLHLELNQFDFNEAELMVRRRGKLVKADREIVVQASTRYPFDLALRQLMLTRESDPSNLNDINIIKTFQLTSEEVDFLRDLSLSDKNFYNIEELAKNHNQDIIKSLNENQLIRLSQDGYLVFESYAIFELINHVFKPKDVRTETIILLNRIRDQAEIGQLPQNRDISIIQKHFEHINDRSLIFELSGQLADTAKAALEGGLYQTAWEILNLATIGLHRTNDYEKMGDLQENIAKGFAQANRDYFAARAFENAGEYFKKAGVEWRSVANFREAGQKYIREAEKANPVIYHYAIRNLIKNSILSYIQANERNKASESLEIGKKILKGYVNHMRYFNTIEI